MAKKKRPAVKSTQTGLRLPDALLRRVEIYRDRLQAQHPGLTVTTTAAMRELLEKGLAAVEAEDK